MAKKQSSTARRPVMVLLDVLGRRWALRILWELREGRLDFRALQEACGGLSPSTLNERLAELRELGIVEHEEGLGYSLTPSGKLLAPTLIELDAWARRHLPTR